MNMSTRREEYNLVYTQLFAKAYQQKHVCPYRKVDTWTLRISPKQLIVLWNHKIFYESQSRSAYTVEYLGNYSHIRNQWLETKLRDWNVDEIPFSINIDKHKKPVDQYVGSYFKCILISYK